MPKRKSKKIKKIKQTLANGKTQILTIEDDTVISTKTLRRRKKPVNIFDPEMKVELF